MTFKLISWIFLINSMKLSMSYSILEITIKFHFMSTKYHFVDYVQYNIKQVKLL